MRDRRAETASRDIDTLFRLGVVAEMSDGQLLERFTAQSDADGQIAFEAIVRRHGPMVLGVCRRVLGRYQAAEDAFQATFLVLALRASTIRAAESLGPWLHGVAARIARRALVSSRRHEHEPLPAQGLVDDAEARDPALADLGGIFDEELGRLPEKYRLPVVLCYLEGRTQEETARTLGWTKGTVSGRLARAKDLLRHRLTRRGLAPSAGLVAAALNPPTASASSSAAVPASLLVPTVRSAVAATLGGAEAGLGMGPVASLARAALKWMLLARLVRAAALSIVLLITAAALATPVLLTGHPGRRDGPVTAPTTPGRLAAPWAGPGPGPGPVAPLLDRYGDPLPALARMRLGTVQRRHGKHVVGIDFTHDGQSAVSVQSDGLACFWDAASGRQARVVNLLGDAPHEEHLISCFAISPDGQSLAAAGYVVNRAQRRDSHAVWVWDLEPHRRERDFTLRRRFDVGPLGVCSLAFAPDGKVIATGNDIGEVRLWDIATGEGRPAFKLGRNRPDTLTFAPDGKIIAAAEQRHGITLWDVENGRATFLANPESSMTAPRFSPDGQLMAAIEVGQVVVLDRTTGLERFKVSAFAAAFAPDSAAIATTGSRDGMLTLTDTRTGFDRWKAHIGWGSFQAGPAFSPDGKVVITEQGGVLRFFDTDSGRERFDSSEAHQAEVTVVQYAPDGRAIFTAGNDGTVRAWDATSARQLRVIPQGGRVSQLALSPDGRSIATLLQSPGGAVSVWDLATGERRRDWSWPGGGFSASALAFVTGTDALLALGRDRGLRILEIATGLERPAGHPPLNMAGGSSPEEAVIDATFSAGNQFLALASFSTARVLDLATGAERCLLPWRGMAFSPDGTAWAVATPGPAEITELADGRKRSFHWNSDAVSVVDLQSGTSRRVAIPNESVVTLALSPDGKTLAVAGGRRQPVVRLYRTDDAREVAALAIPAAVSFRRALAFSPDGRSLAAGLNDTTIMIWDVTNLR